MPPNPVKSVNSNEHNKNETAADSQKPSCKMCFIEPGTLTKKKFNSTSSFHNNFILFNDKNKPSAVNIFTQLSLSMNELKHATRKDVGGVCGKQFSFLKHILLIRGV